jgi:hypothetical protein
MSLVTLSAPGGKSVYVDAASVVAIRDADRPENGSQVLLASGAIILATTSPSDTKTALGL